MNCVKCGNPLTAGENFCGFCGARVEQEQTAILANEEATGVLTQADPEIITPVATQPEPVPCSEIRTRKEFFNRFAARGTKSWVIAMIIVCFVTAGLSLVLLAMGSVLSLLDIALYVTMGVLLLTTKNWIFALIPTAYSGFFSLINLAYGGNISGVFAIIAGIMSTIALNKINRAFKVYKTQKILPDREI